MLHGERGKGQLHIASAVRPAGNGERPLTADTTLPPLTHDLLNNNGGEHAHSYAGGGRPASAHPHVLLPGKSVLLGDLLQLQHPALVAGHLPEWGQQHLCSWLCYTTTFLWLVAGFWLVGFLISMVLTSFLSGLKFCGPKAIDHFCDFTPLLELTCSDTRVLRLATLLLHMPSPSCSH